MRPGCNTHATTRPVDSSLLCSFLHLCPWLVAGSGTALAASPESGGLVVEDEQVMEPAELLAEVALRYPEEAVAAGRHADVRVQVGIDSRGEVTDVTVLSGPELFEAEAIRAARRLEFAPATRGGKPVPSTSVITFHFAPPELQEIVVVGVDEDRRDPHASTTLDEADLDQRAGQDTAEVVSQVAGVEASRGNAATSKPIIRGQSERRILLLEDGVRHESQKWGPDHAPEVDPFSAGSIRVVKGAAGARYGPDAIGGVLLVDPPPLRDTRGVEGKALLSGALNGPAGYLAARLDVVPTDRLSMRIEGNFRRAASARSPEYVLGNTALRTWNGGVALRYGTDASHVRVTFRHYDLLAGIFFGVRGATDELGADPTPAQVTAWSEDRFAIARPRQSVTHDRATVHLHHTTRGGFELEGIYAFQLNQRREFESVQFAFEGPEYDFTLLTNSIDLVAEHPEARLGSVGFTGGIGAQGLAQTNLYEGSTLLPNYNALQAGLFAFERVEPTPELAFEVGARVDGLSRAALLAGPDVARQQAEGNLTEREIAEACRQGEFRLVCPSSWTGASVSLGGVWHGLDDRLTVKLDLSTASRFPSADEQYLIGSAPSFPVWAIGDFDLGVETTQQAQTTIGVRVPAVEAELSGYANRIPSYIYFAPDRADPERTTLVGIVPQYRYQPIRAGFLGADGAVEIGPRAPVSLRLTGSVVRAVDQDTGEFLVGIPPNRGAATLVVRPPVRFTTELSLTVEGVARQGGPPLDADLIPPPDGYALLSASAAVEVPLGRRLATVAVDGFNLLDARYREYASLLRYYADFPGRDVRLRLGLRF